MLPEWQSYTIAYPSHIFWKSLHLSKPNSKSMLAEGLQKQVHTLYTRRIYNKRILFNLSNYYIVLKVLFDGTLRQCAASTYALATTLLPGDQVWLPTPHKTIGPRNLGPHLPNWIQPHKALSADPPLLCLKRTIKSLLGKEACRKKTLGVPQQPQWHEISSHAHILATSSQSGEPQTQRLILGTSFGQPAPRRVIHTQLLYQLITIHLTT